MLKRYRPSFDSLEDRACPALFTVTNTLDNGAGSLRAAIQAANATVGADLIQFSIDNYDEDSGTSSPVNIQLLTPLDAITEEVDLDGFGAGPGGDFNAPRVYIDGRNLTGSAHGLEIFQANNVTVRSLAFIGFPGDGVVVRESTNTTLHGLWIGAVPYDSIFGGGNVGFIPQTGGAGVRIVDSTNTNMDGAYYAWQQNHITNSALQGVVTEGTTTRTNLGDAIISGNVGLAFDQGNDGVTRNDIGDTDGVLNSPTLTYATASDDLQVIQGIYQGAANTTIQIELYANDGASKGRELQDALSIWQIVTDANGFATFEAYMGFYPFNPLQVTAIARANGETSEVSAAPINYALANSTAPTAPANNYFNQDLFLYVRDAWNEGIENVPVDLTFSPTGFVNPPAGRYFTDSNGSITIQRTSLVANSQLGTHSATFDIAPFGDLDFQLPISMQVLPSADLGGASEVQQGATYSLTLNFAPALSEPNEFQRWIINWGDGNTESFFSTSGVVTHDYAGDFGDGYFVSAIVEYYFDGQNYSVSADNYLLVDVIPPPGIYVVDTTDDTIADDGYMSLREAIQFANADGIASTIFIDIPYYGEGESDSDIFFIDLTSALPTITETLTIDGTRQFGYSDVGPRVVLYGGNLSSGSGLVFQGAGNSVVRGLSISSFAGDGIQINNSANVRIEDCYIGVEPSGGFVSFNFGPAMTGNGGAGIRIVNSFNAEVIGNLIANNQLQGVVITGSTRTLIDENSIYDNGGIGIDYGNDGVSVNVHNFSRPEILNYPVITYADTGYVEGFVFGPANSFLTVQIFYNSNSSSTRQAGSFLASMTVFTDANGFATFQFGGSPGSYDPGQLTAIAIDYDDHRTSEVSPRTRYYTNYVGNGQSTGIGSAFIDPVGLQFFDAYGVGVDSIPVEFEYYNAEYGGPGLQSGINSTVLSNTDGEAYIPQNLLVANEEIGFFYLLADVLPGVENFGSPSLNAAGTFYLGLENVPAITVTGNKTVNFDQTYEITISANPDDDFIDGWEVYWGDDSVSGGPGGEEGEGNNGRGPIAPEIYYGNNITISHVYASIPGNIDPHTYQIYVRGFRDAGEGYIVYYDAPVFFVDVLVPQIEESESGSGENDFTVVIPDKIQVDVIRPDGNTNILHVFIGVYSTDPGSGNRFNVVAENDGRYPLPDVMNGIRVETIAYDLKVVGAMPGDVIIVRFKIPEPNLLPNIFFLTPAGLWVLPISSPNFPGTGVRVGDEFIFAFDHLSFPRIDQLTGTVFTITDLPPIVNIFRPPVLLNNGLNAMPPNQRNESVAVLNAILDNDDDADDGSRISGGISTSQVSIYSALDGGGSGATLTPEEQQKLAEQWLEMVEDILRRLRMGFVPGPAAGSPPANNAGGSETVAPVDQSYQWTRPVEVETAALDRVFGEWKAPVEFNVVESAAAPDLLAESARRAEVKSFYPALFLAGFAMSLKHPPRRPAAMARIVRRPHVTFERRRHSRRNAFFVNSYHARLRRYFAGVSSRIRRWRRRG